MSGNTCAPTTTAAKVAERQRIRKRIRKVQAKLNESLDAVVNQKYISKAFYYETKQMNKTYLDEILVHYFRIPNPTQEANLELEVTTATHGAYNFVQHVQIALHLRRIRHERGLRNSRFLFDPSIPFPCWICSHLNPNTSNIVYVFHHEEEFQKNGEIRQNTKFSHYTLSYPSIVNLFLQRFEIIRIWHWDKYKTVYESWISLFPEEVLDNIVDMLLIIHGTK